jgi:hypothetical protein
MQPTIDSLVMRASGAIARRQRRGRIARWLSLPALLATVWFGQLSVWINAAGLGTLIVLLALITIGMYQKCPRCRAPLVTQHVWGKDFAQTCPECGCPID